MLLCRAQARCGGEGNKTIDQVWMWNTPLHSEVVEWIAKVDEQRGQSEESVLRQ